MRIELICIEKTKKIEYKNIIQDYLKRINKKLKISVKEITFYIPKKGSSSIKPKNLIFCLFVLNNPLLYSCIRSFLFFRYKLTQSSFYKNTKSKIYLFKIH